MAERGNDTHRRIISQATHLDSNMLRWTESICNTPHSSVPPYPLWDSVDPYRSDDEDDDVSKHDFLRNPTTSCRIYLEDATTVVYRFASSLPRGAEDGPTEAALFEFEDEQKEFDMPRTYICTVLLPGTPVHRTSGPPSISRAIARRAACYRVCEELVKIGLIDCHLFPLSSNVEVKGDDVTDPPSDKGGARSYLRKQPDFWINTGSACNGLLYPMIISSDHTEEGVQRHAPLLILTRQPLPDLASFKLFFAGVPAAVTFKRGAPYQPDHARLHDLHLYTVRLCRTISNKPYVCSMADMVYFFAPLTLKWSTLKESEAVLPNVVEHIPWDLVSLAGDNFVVPLRSSTLADLEQDIKDAVIQDRWVEFTRRYNADRMRPDLTPLSKPLDSPVRGVNFRQGAWLIKYITIPIQREADHESLLDFCKARRKNFEGLQDNGQPIIEVSMVANTLNLLNPTSRELTSSTRTPAKCMSTTLIAWRYLIAQ
jgi:endoribonuclease Dicer